MPSATAFLPSRAAPPTALRSKASQPSRAVPASGVVAAIAVFAPVWAPSPLGVGEFSAAFLLPFALAVWAMSRPRFGPGVTASLYGTGGNGLWIEMLCVGTALLFAALSMLVADEPQRALRVILPMAYGLCTFIVLTSLTPLSARRLVYAMMSAGVIVTAVGLMMTQIAGIRGIVMLDYRFTGFFGNANQPALVIVTIWPAIIALLLNSRTKTNKIIIGLATAILGFGLILTGTKTGMAICFISACLIYLYNGARADNIERAIFSLLLCVALIALCIPLGLQILEWANPIAFRKVSQVLYGGLQEYHSIRSRNLIWDKSISLGMSSPLLGDGAGGRIMGKSHSHNMIIDYFRGMGVFGMISAVVLVAASVVRATIFYFATIRKGQVDKPIDVLTLGFYLGGVGYLIGNQISDSFSPSTAFSFWMVYICAYLCSAERTARPMRPRPLSARRWEPRAASITTAPPGHAAF